VVRSVGVGEGECSTVGVSVRENELGIGDRDCDGVRAGEIVRGVVTDCVRVSITETVRVVDCPSGELLTVVDTTRSPIASAKRVRVLDDVFERLLLLVRGPVTVRSTVHVSVVVNLLTIVSVREASRETEDVG
jgi:hypothetical protein